MTSQPVASIHRTLDLRLRADLLATPVEMAGLRTWVVKDPITLEHFQFSAEEYALLDRLRQPASLADLQREYADAFPPRTIQPPAIWDFISRLHHHGLLISMGEGQGRELLARQQRDRARQWMFAWTQLLAIRFRGFDPDSFLTAVHANCRFLFSRAAIGAACLVVLFALSLVVGQFDTFWARLPEISALADWRNLVWLLLAMGLVKVLHELAHALVCKHYGGEVHELGLLLLAFTPCLYCDVTDAWRFPSKWHRILVSAAGILAELVLGAMATIVWWYAQPGLVQLVALNLMLVCTVSTLLINGNPLLRYDGYYILSDLVEVPNLWQRSRDVLRNWASRWLLGQDEPEETLTPSRHRTWLAFYAAASKIYLLVVLVSIVWLLVLFLHPFHLQNLAYMIGTVVLVRNPSRRGKIRKGRLAMVTSIGAAAAVALLAMPVTYHVRAPLVLLPDGASRIYASAAGQLFTTLPVGSWVEQGQTVAKLVHAEETLALARLEGEHALLRLRQSNLETLRGTDRASSDQIPAARAAFEDIDRQLRDRRRDAKRLTLVAPISGWIIPAPRLPKHSADKGRLQAWSGSLLDEANQGAQVEPGTLVCLVGDPKRVVALLLVEDTDASRVKPSQTVRVRLDQLPAQVFEGQVVEVSRHDRRSQGSAFGRADLEPLLTGIVPPGRETNRYQVRVNFTPGEQTLVLGGRGEAKIATEQITLARKLWRWMAQTFRLPM